MNFYETMKSLGLADLPNWTISTLQKAPLAPKPALKAHFNPDTFQEWFKFASDPDNTLVTLTALYNEPNTPKDKIALHVNIDTQHIMLLDIERDYDTSINKYLKKLPVVYGERSVHGGLHYIVPIPEHILNNPKYMKLFLKSQIKIGTENKAHSGVEIFMHNHYLTFTQNQVRSKNNNTDEDLKEVLDYLLEDVNTNVIKRVSFIDKKDSIPTDALVIAKHAVSEKQKRGLQKYIDKNTNANISEREFGNISTIAKDLKKAYDNYFLNYPFAPGELLDKNASSDLKMIAWALLYLTSELVPYREKWDKIVSGDQTYIEYTCNKVMSNTFKK